jgi:hypothetical protein
MLFDAKTYPAEALKLKVRDQKAHKFCVLARARLKRWQDLVNETLWDVIDNNEMPNLEFGKW